MAFIFFIFYLFIYLFIYFFFFYFFFFFVYPYRIISGCYGNLQLTLAYNGRNEKWHLLLIHCRYFDKSFTEISLEKSLPSI